MIIVEGADGTGKTTLCKQIAEKLNMQYLKIPRHKNDMELNGFKFYVEQAESIPDNCIVDRFHIGEMVYPRLYTDDTRAPLKMWQQHCIERVLKIRGAVLVHVMSNYDFIEKNYKQRNELFSEIECKKECEYFAESIFNSILFKQSYITTHSNSGKFITYLEKFHNILKEKYAPLQKYFGIGSAHYPVMIVGDSLNKNYGTKYCFNAWTGSSAYLQQALDIAGCKSNYYLTNAHKGNENDAGDLLQENFQINPICRIALGQKASQLLNQVGLKHTVIEHPAYHQRFKHDVYEYAHQISELIP